MAKKKSKLPNRLAGIKVPKAYRGVAGHVMRIGQSPLGREIAAGALIAAAGALTGSKAARAAAGKAGDKAHDLAEDAGAAAGRLGHVIAEAITSVAQRIHPGESDRPANKPMPASDLRTGNGRMPHVS